MDLFFINSRDFLTDPLHYGYNSAQYENPCFCVFLVSRPSRRQTDISFWYVIFQANGQD
jgi:hypothetical protein